MSVLNRRLFNKGGRVMSSRGVGITSGLVPSYAHGGLHQESSIPDLEGTMSERLKLLESLNLGRPELSSKSEMLAPSLLKFFGGLMSGKSYQGGLGGGLDIAGQTLQASAPDFAQAQTAIKKEKLAQTNFDNTLKLKAFDMAYDEVSKAKAKANEFVKGDFKTFYNKKDGNQTVSVNLSDPGAQVYTNSEFLNNYSLEKPDDFKEANTQTFYSKVNGNSITVNKANPDSPLYKDKFFLKTYTDVKPDVPKKPALTTFYNKKDDSETIEIDLNDRSSEYFTDPKFLETYTSTAPKDIKLKTVYFNPLNVEEGGKPSDKFKTAQRKVVGNKISYTFNGEEYSEKDFLAEIGQNISEQLPAGVTNSSLLAGDRLLDTKKIINEMYKKEHPEQSDLTENELNQIVALHVDQSKGTLYDVKKTTDFGTINELFDEFANINSNRKGSADNKNALNGIDQVLAGDIDVIDLIYGLDKNMPSYKISRAAAVDAYSKLESMSDDDQNAVRGAISALQDLSMIDPNQAIALIGGPIGAFVETFGINEATAEFLTGRRGLLLTSVDLLVKGIPSDFDVRNVDNTLPSLSVAPSTNVLRIRRLDKFFKNIILNKVKFDLQTGKKVPMEMLQAAIAAGGDNIARELLVLQQNGGDPEIMKYIQGMSDGAEGYTKDGFIETFGDPFATANKIMQGDEQIEFTDKNQEELDYFKKKYGVTE